MNPLVRLSFHDWTGPRILPNHPKSSSRHHHSPSSSSSTNRPTMMMFSCYVSHNCLLRLPCRLSQHQLSSFATVVHLLNHTTSTHITSQHITTHHNTTQHNTTQHTTHNNMSRILTLLILALASSSCSSLSALSSSTSSRRSSPAKTPANNFFSSITSQFQRKDIKRKLIRAAESKDEPLILSLVEELSRLNPTECPTRGLATTTSQNNNNNKAPLNGQWRLLYTNAKDAEAPARTQKDNNNNNNKEERRTTTFGETVAEGVQVTTGQRIDAPKGECVNFISLAGEKRPFDLLEITIRMTPLSDTRVRLDFLRGRALNERAPLPFLKDFRFSFPPAAFGDFLARLRGKDPKVEPPAYFDVLYVDEELRAHRTGEGKIFVQQRTG
jgi:hypothetical protein